MKVTWHPATSPPSHNKDVLLQERGSNLMYVGHYNALTKKYIFIEKAIDVKCWTELPEPC